MTVTDLLALAEEFWTKTTSSSVAINRQLLESIINGWQPRQDPHLDAVLLIKVLALHQEAVSNEHNLGDLLLSSLTHWTKLLREYFEDPKRASLPPSIMVKKQLDGDDSKSEKLAIWDNEASWREDIRIKNIFSWCLSTLRDGVIVKFEDASKLIPFVLHIAEDYQPENRLLGVSLIRNYIRIVSDKILQQLNLEPLFYQILMKNLGYEPFVLKETTLECLFECVLARKTKNSLCWYEELLGFLTRESLFTKEENVRLLYLRCLPQVIRLLEIASVCHIKPILSLLIDLPMDDDIANATIHVIEALLENAWPRLSNHLPLLVQIMRKLEDTNVRTSTLQKLDSRLELLGS